MSIKVPGQIDSRVEVKVEHEKIPSVFREALCGNARPRSLFGARARGNASPRHVRVRAAAYAAMSTLQSNLTFGHLYTFRALWCITEIRALASAY